MGDGRGDGLVEDEIDEAAEAKRERILWIPKRWILWIEPEDVAGVAGVGLLFYGAHSIYPPAAFLLIGTILTLYAVGKSKSKGIANGIHSRRTRASE